MTVEILRFLIIQSYYAIMNSRNTTLDCVKGFLMISAMISNFLHKVGDPNPYCNYILYTYHMPLFLAVAGFFISRKTIRLPFSDFFKKYLYRILIPFFIAWTCHYFLWNQDKLGWKSFWNSIQYPMFHFWFIYNYILSLLSLWILVHLNIDEDVILMLGIMVTALSMIITSSIPSASRFVVSYQPYYFGFFVGGFYIRQKNITYSPKTLRIFFILTLVLFILRIALADHNRFTKITGDFIAFNIFASQLIIGYGKNHPQKRNKTFEWIGRNTYPIYLWHPFLATLISYTPILYWAKLILGVVVYIGFFGMIYILKRSAFVSKYLFGEIYHEKNYD